jgi:hypothetical protein
MVKSIEEFCSKFESLRLSQAQVFCQSHIKVVNPRPMKETRIGISKLT